MNKTVMLLLLYIVDVMSTFLKKCCTDYMHKKCCETNYSFMSSQMTCDIILYDI